MVQAKKRELEMGGFDFLGFSVFFFFFVGFWFFFRRKWEIGFELITTNTLIANEKCEVELSRFNGHSSSLFFFLNK